jgi:hypothetical protein
MGGEEGRKAHGVCHGGHRDLRYVWQNIQKLTSFKMCKVLTHASSGAPERHPDRRGTVNAVHQAIDIWSLGCVFSLAATWVVLGETGMGIFSQIRENAIKDIVKRQHRHSHPFLHEGDYFHDGRDVLPDVVNWHNLLRNSQRKSDVITNRVLDVVDSRMMLGDANLRSKAEDIYRDLKEILAQSQAKPRCEFPESFMKALLMVDEQARSRSTTAANTHPSQITTVDTKGRTVVKSSVCLMKTTHRSGILKSALAAPGRQSEASNRTLQAVQHPLMSAPLAPINTAVAPSAIRQPDPTTRTRSSTMTANYAHEPPQPDDFILSSTSTPGHLLRAARASEITTPPPQNVWQARAAVEKARSEGRTVISRRFSRTPKDAVLTSYFDDRDIVRYFSMLLWNVLADNVKDFLVDNAESMKAHWDEAIYLIETLAMKAAGQDKDGMDLFFTCGPVQLKSCNRPKDFADAMRVAGALPKDNVHTDITKKLFKILDDYKKEIELERRAHYKKVVKNLTVIVLTDGLWNGMMGTQDRLYDMIVTFIKELGLLMNLSNRPVSIGFIQFGHDPAATLRLQRLDNDITKEDLPLVSPCVIILSTPANYPK